jgi:hypothetical protein
MNYSENSELSDIGRYKGKGSERVFYLPRLERMFYQDDAVVFGRFLSPNEQRVGWMPSFILFLES